MTSPEDQLIRWFAARNEQPATNIPINIGDDMAEVSIAKGQTALVTIDMMLEGVHFQLDKASLLQIGYKAVAVSLSDCAAMATIPLAVVIAVGLPQNFDQQQLKQLHTGIKKAVEYFNCALVGGDITRWRGGKALVICSAMLSKPAKKPPVKRSGAKPRDVICVTGKLGGSRLGKHLDFTPRVNEALQITKIASVNSMIDISDGLSTDLIRICDAGRVGAVIESNRIPLSEIAKQNSNPVESALNDGEDFELLFTLSQKEYDRLSKYWQSKTPITCIGKITKGDKVRIKYPDGRVQSLTAGGYDHFKTQASQ